MKRKFDRAGALLQAACLAFLSCPARAASQTARPPGELLFSSSQELAVAGVNLLMNGDPHAAIGKFRSIQMEDPQSPLGYLLEADAVWWKIYYTTGNLIDPDVFDVISSPSTPYDAHFDDLIQMTIEKAKACIRTRRDRARCYFYEGMAYGLEARLAGLRGKDLPTARAGKKMRSLLLTALRYDPNLTDAYLGVGIYNYFVATLPDIVKLLRWMIGLPGGSRTLGLQQLQRAADGGTLVSAEAQFYLAKDYSRRNEQQLAESLAGFQKLAADYPQNGLWKLLAGSLEIRLGLPAQGLALYRQALLETDDSKSEVQRSLHHAAFVALQRIHPGQKIE